MPIPLYIDSLAPADTLRLSRAAAENGGEVICLVHPWYHGTTEAAAEQDIGRMRASALNSCVVSRFVDPQDETRQVSDAEEARLYMRYLQGMIDFVRCSQLRLGLLVEVAAQVGASLARIEAENADIVWVVVPTVPHKSSELSNALLWPEVTKVLAQLGVRHAVVFGANNHYDNACVPAAARHLREGGIPAEVNAEVSFAYLGQPR